MKVNPTLIEDEELELIICKALSLHEYEVKPFELQACHYLKKGETVTVKFQSHY